MGALLPPPQYDHPPSIPVIEKVLTHAEIQKIMSRPYDPDMWARATPLAPVITDTVFRAISGPTLAPWPTTRSDEK